jgi:hypothetical protein
VRLAPEHAPHRPHHEEDTPVILADIKNGADESAYYNFFHGGRFVLVRYIDGPRDEVIRTQAEAEKAAVLALATHPDERVLTVS